MIEFKADKSHNIGFKQTYNTSRSEPSKFQGGFLNEEAAPSVSTEQLISIVCQAPQAEIATELVKQTQEAPIKKQYRVQGVPVLKVTPYVWQKLLYLRDKSQNEIGFFGITKEDDPLYIIDLAVLKQKVGPASVEFDGPDIARFWMKCDSENLIPAQYTRVWIHTHPGNSATPSGTDENTFTRHWGQSDWALMVVVARDNTTTVRLRYNTGIPADYQLNMKIEYDADFPGSNKTLWDQEFTENVSSYVSSYRGNFYGDNWGNHHSPSYGYPLHRWNRDQAHKRSDYQDSDVHDPLIDSPVYAANKTQSKHSLWDLYDLIGREDFHYLLTELKIDNTNSCLDTVLSTYFIFDSDYALAKQYKRNTFSIYRESTYNQHTSLVFEKMVPIPSLANFMTTALTSETTVDDLLKSLEAALRTTQETEEVEQHDLYLDPNRQEIETPQSEITQEVVIAADDITKQSLGE